MAQTNDSFSLTETQGPDKMSRNVFTLLAECVFWRTIRSTHKLKYYHWLFDDAEHVTPQATHARYEGEAHTQPSASAVCTIQNIVVNLGFFFRNYGVFCKIFFASPSGISPDATQNNSVARKGERSKSTSSGLLFTSRFPVDRLRSWFLLSDVAGKNNPDKDVRGTVKRAAIIQLGTEGDQQGVGLVSSLFSSCVCRWDVAEFRWLDSHFSGLQGGSVRRRSVTLWGLVAETRLPDRPHVGTGVGVPFWDSAALSTRSRRRFAAPAA